VAVKTAYVDAESNKAAHRFYFAYTITISNRGGDAARLRSRHWIITDGEAAVREVKGAGVVGEQPRIPPGRTFRYTSACVLDTPVGTMRGSYQFETDSGEMFDVPIPMFTLSVPNAVH
jgi:ApaG protein